VWDASHVTTSMGSGDEATDQHVSDAQAGDEYAFGVLYRNLHPPLLRYLRVLVGTDAEDVAAETWVQVCRDLRRFHGGLPAFRGWVTTIGRNRALDHLRAARRRPVSLAPPEEITMSTTVPDVAEVVASTLATRDALEMVASLPREQAEAIMLRVVLDLDANTAGAILGRRAGAVRTAAHRGLRALARRMEEDRTRERDGSAGTGGGSNA